MNFLERAIRRGVSQAVSNAVGQAVRKAVEPAATNLANQAAQHLDQATQQATQQVQQAAPAVQNAAGGLTGAMANLERAAQDYATRAAENMKVCPNCQQPTTADKKFCPQCGTKLPEQTVAQGAVCPNCGKQNSIGMKFCSDCGTKLPAAIAEEQAKQARDEAELAQWDTLLPQYPRWTCGGSDFNLEEYDPGTYIFSAGFNGNTQAAYRAVEQYRQILLQNGFRQAGQYPSMQQLFKRVDGVVYNVDTEHCFEGDPDRACISFSRREPYGGFDYVKPEPKKQVGLKDLFKF